MKNLIQQMTVLFEKKAKLEKKLEEYDEKKIYGQIRNMFDAMSSELEQLEEAVNLAEYTRELWERESLIDSALRLGVGKRNSKKILEAIEDIIELQEFRNQVTQIMNQTDKQYDKVAEILVKYHARGLAKLKDIYCNYSSNEVASHITDSCQYMEDTKSHVSDVFIKRLESTNDDTISLSLKTLSFFPALGTSEQALQVWTKYVMLTIFNHEHYNLDNLKTEGGSLDLLSELLCNLLQDVEQSLVLHFDCINDIFGATAASKLICDISNEMYTNATKIYSEFSRVTAAAEGRADIIKARQIYRHSGNGANRIQIKIDNEVLENIVVNISKILHKANRFYNTAQSVVQKLTEADQRNAPTVISWKSNWSTFIDDLRSSYISLEMYFIRITTEKAINSKPLNTRNSIDTSVDDFFFVINSFVLRSVLTLDIQAVRSIVQCVCTITETEYIEKATNSLEKLVPRGSNDEILLALFWLNYLDTGSIYALKLSEKLKTELSMSSSMMSGISDSVIESLCGYTDSTSAVIMEKKKTWIDEYIRMRLHSYIENSWVQYFRIAQYEISDKAEVNDQYQDQTFKTAISFTRKYLYMHAKHVSENNFYSIASVIAEIIAKLWETHIFSKRFTKLGALKLSSEVHQLSDVFSTVFTARNRLKMIRHMSSILNIESIQDLQEIVSTLLSSNTDKSNLTQSDINKIASLRTDL